MFHLKYESICLKTNEIRKCEVNMKILFLANANSVHTVRWVNALIDKGHDVHLVYNNNDSPKNNTINSKVVHHRLRFSGNKGYYLNIFQMRKII